MNWIEWLLGLSPDNGDGSFETQIVLALGAVMIVLFTWRRRKRQGRFTLKA